MKFFRWLFSVKVRHRSGITRYERGGAGVRMLTVAVLLLFAGAAIGLEIWSFSLLSAGNMLCILTFILAAGLVIASEEYAVVYSFAGFKMFARGVIDRNTAAPSGERARCGGDLFVGIFCLLAAIALPVGVVAVFLSM